MGLLNRISLAMSQNAANKNSVEQTRVNFGNNFPYNALKSRTLTNDTFTSSNTVKKTSIQTVPIKDDELALNYPAQFIYKYLNKATIEKAIKTNPNISRILKENGLETKYYMQNANGIIMSHLIPTSRKAQETYRNMGHNKTEPNYVYLTEAALLHDIGKVFIPPEILNKRGKLNSKERKIVELHNQLSYEILKTTNLNPKVVELAKEHHNYDKKVKPNDENQVLTMADIYCALKEDRPYKKAVDDYTTRAIMYDMASKGLFDIKYMPYLKI